MESFAVLPRLLGIEVNPHAAAIAELLNSAMRLTARPAAPAFSSSYFAQLQLVRLPCSSSINKPNGARTLPDGTFVAQ
jgi:hypothetical protein